MKGICSVGSINITELIGIAISAIGGILSTICNIIVILINFERFALTPSPSPRAGEGSQESP